MKQIKCEMCGGTDLIKEEGFFKCENCGCKYSIEEARKLMVEIEGAIKIDNSEEIANLYLLARRSKDVNNFGEACKYYDMVLIKDPNSWEAAFYSLIFKSLQSKIIELAQTCVKIRQELPAIIDLVKNGVDDAEKNDVFNEISSKIEWITDIFCGNAQNYLKNNAEKERAVFVAAGNIAFSFALELRKTFPNREYIDSEMYCIKQGVKIQYFRIQKFSIDNNEKERAIYFDWAQTVKQYDPNYIIPELPSLLNA